jgi:hypothetical protein
VPYEDEDRGGGERRSAGVFDPHDVMRQRQQVAEAVAASIRGVPYGEVPARLCAVCVDLLPVTGAAISLDDGTGVRATLCATDVTAARLAETQNTLGEGPCLEVVSLRAPVFAPDLTGVDARRWPVFAQQAVALGAEAVFALPLGTGAVGIGTMDIYRSGKGSLDERETLRALLVADAVTSAMVGLQAASSGRPDSLMAGWMAQAQGGHDEVHHAVGMLMMQMNIGPDEALARLRAHAFAEERSVAEVARDVIARKVRLDE